LRIHSAYIDYLVTGSLPPSTANLDPSWCNPIIQRTKWYDLFDIVERVEAARGLWGVLHYLARAEAAQDKD
jgi:hypothetical protein